MANFTNTQTDGSNEAFLVAFDTNYINSDGTLGRTYNLNLGVTYAQLAADPANALIAYQNAGKDLSLDSNWSTFKTLGAGETTQNIIYGIFAAGDMLGTKYQGYFSSGTMTQAPPVEANTTPPGSVTITWKGQIDAINVHAAEIARGNTTATTSTLVKSTDTANTGQVDSKLGYRQTFEGGTSEQDNFVSYGSSNDFYFNSTHLGTYVRRGKTYDAAIIAQSDIAKVGTFTLSGNTLKYVPASVVTPNIAPTFSNFTSTVVTTKEDTQSTITFDNLITNSDAKDADGSVTAFDIKSVTSGTLLIGADAATATAWDSNTNFTIDATHQAFWTPDLNASGVLNAFTAVAVDNAGLGSVTPIQATVAVTFVNYAPTFTNFAAPLALGNEDSQISISLDNLKAQGNEADNDGTVNGFVIKGVSSGTLLIGSSLATATAWNASSNNSIDASHLAFWTPATNANGTLNAFTVVAKDNEGLESALPVQATVSVTEVNDLPTGIVKITGTPTQNQILTASNTLADVDGLGTIVYQWQANGVSIVGANKPTYTLGQTEVGKTVTVKASYTDGYGHNESVLSPATSKVQQLINPGVIFNNIGNLTTTEIGGTASYGVRLTTAPRHDVTLKLTSNDATEGVFASTQTTTQTLTFTAANWNQVQTVKLKGVDDKLVDGDISYIVSTLITSNDLRYDGMRSGTGLAIKNIVALNADDDMPDEQYGDKGGNPIADYLIGGNGASDIYGKNGRDELRGGNGDDRLYGGDGDDVLYGEADNDQLKGEQGEDKLYGGDGNDTLNGGTGNDKLSGGNGNDVLEGSTGADTMDGGNGADTYYVDNAKDVVSDSGTNTGVVDTVNIASYISSTFTYALGVGIENAVLNDVAKDADLTGNASNNTLSGNGFDNQLAGGDGKDKLNGGSGNDTLNGGIDADILNGGSGNDLVYGGAGLDNLTGGTGADLFDFNAISESVTGKSHDIIKDFTRSQTDKIDLKGIDANSKVTGDQAFSYIGTKSFSGKAGEIHYLNGVLSGDINGDKVADFEIAITLVGSTSLVVGDFIL